jgi:hypothetical protein
LPNPGYGSAYNYQQAASGNPTPGGQNASMEQLLNGIADMMKNQFGLKLKNPTFSYRMSFPEWYHRVALPTGVKIPEFTKFTGQDGTSTIEHISRYLMQLGEASSDQAFRI